MSNTRPIPRLRRGFTWLPLDFSRSTPSPKSWRAFAALCIFISVAPLALVLPMGWVFMLRIMVICALGAYKPQGLAARLTLAATDFGLLLWWMFSGYPQAPTELALAVFALGVSFKAMELSTVGDGYMASAMCFLGPFIAIIQHLPAWAVLPSCSSIVLALILRSGMSCVESGQDPGLPWKSKHWRSMAAMLAMALPVALAFFWVLPRLPAPYFGLGQQSQSGISETMEPGSMDRLMQSAAQAFTVKFNGERPPQSQIYWRTFVLTSFNGRTWFQVGMPPDAETFPVVSPSTPIYSYTMTLMPVAGPYVPLMDRPLSIQGDRTIETSTMTYRSTSTPGSPRSFSGTSAPSAKLDVGVISPVVRRASLLLPDGYNPKTRALMAKWKSQGYSDERLVARTLEYFRDNMTYSYTPPLLGKNSVDELMFDTQEGFCEHFSSSFVFAMRAAGIPSRVISGYQGGREMPNGLWEVRQLDAHAWTEVWIENKGWLRVDPTFSVVKKRPPPPGENESAGFELDMPWMSWVHGKTKTWFGGFNQQSQKDLFSRWKAEGWSKWFVALGVGVIIMAWAFSALFFGWQSDRLPKEVVQWEKFQRQACLLTGLDRSATPRQILSSLSPKLHADSLSLVNDAVRRWEDWRYAGREDPGLAKDLAHARKLIKSL